MVYAVPGQPGSLITPKAQYGNFIGGKWVAPVNGQYFDNISPVNGKSFTSIPRSTAEDINLALDAAHAAADAWGRTSVTERANILLKIADRMEANLEMLAVAETYDNGKGVRETLAADMPLAIDHFRYFAGAIRAQEGSLGELDDDTVAYHFHEPLGVVGQIIPWNFPILMAVWKLAPALAAGNCVVLKPAEQTPWSILVLMELIEDLLPAGVLNVVNGFGLEAGKPLASSPRIAKIAFTGETTTGRLIMQYASQNIIPVTLELGGKSPNIFLEDVADHDDDFFDKAVEGFVMFALNQGEVCTCPSRALIHESIYDKFMERAVARTKAIIQGNPFDPATMIGAQASNDQLEKILSYIDIGSQEGAQCITGGKRKIVEGMEEGFYVEPTIFTGHNKMRIFQEEIFGPVLSVTTFKTVEEALEIANDTLYGLGAGVWTRNVHDAYRLGRGIKAGRVWTNCYHAYPAHAAFGGYKQSGIGRETHKMMLEHYQQTKNLLVSYSPKKLGFFLNREMWVSGSALTHILVGGEMERVGITAEAEALLQKLIGMHGPLLFHQSGGCCDGSAPMCYPRNEFMVGDVDVCLGWVGSDSNATPFYMSGPQFEYWKHTHLTVDIVPGRGSGFSVEATEGVRFIIRSRIYTDAEWLELEKQPVPNGPQH